MLERWPSGSGTASIPLAGTVPGTVPVAESIGQYVEASLGVAAVRCNVSAWKSGSGVEVTGVGHWNFGDATLQAIGVMASRPITHEEHLGFVKGGAVFSIARDEVRRAALAWTVDRWAMDVPDGATAARHARDLRAALADGGAFVRAPRSQRAR